MVTLDCCDEVFSECIVSFCLTSLCGDQPISSPLCSALHSTFLYFTSYRDGGHVISQLTEIVLTPGQQKRTQHHDQLGG